MVDAGIPRDRIGQVTGDVTTDKRQKIVDAVNGTYEKDEHGDDVLVTPATLDVVVGTAAMSEGMNLQVRGCAIHHLDLPWTAATLQQRNGRAVRQKNRWAMETKKPVELFYYLAERSFDGYKLQAVTGKAGWTETLFKSSSKSANNPMADSQADPLALVDLFARDPEATRAIVLDRMAELQVGRLQRAHRKVRERFRSFVSVAQRARSELDADRAQAYARAAAAEKEVFEGLPVEQMQTKELIDLAMTKALVWSPGRVTKGDQGNAIVGPESWVIEGEPFATFTAYELQSPQEGSDPSKKSANALVTRVSPASRVFDLQVMGNPSFVERTYQKFYENSDIQRPVAFWDEAAHLERVRERMLQNKPFARYTLEMSTLAASTMDAYPHATIVRQAGMVDKYVFATNVSDTVDLVDDSRGQQAFIPVVVQAGGDARLVLVATQVWLTLGMRRLVSGAGFSQFGNPWSDLCTLMLTTRGQDAIKMLSGTIGWPLMPTPKGLEAFRAFDSATQVLPAASLEASDSRWDKALIVWEKPASNTNYKKVQQRWFGVKPVDLVTEDTAQKNPPRTGRAFFRQRSGLVRR